MNDALELSPLARRLASDALELHRSRVLNSAHERVSDGSYAEFGPLNVHRLEDACAELKRLSDSITR